jgi:hypothetical protein
MAVAAVRPDRYVPDRIAGLYWFYICDGLPGCGRSGATGFDYAVQERYATGSLLAWQAPLILLLSRLETRTALHVLAALIV